MANDKLLFRILLNSALGIALIFIWSRFVDLNQILGILKTVDLKYVGAFFVLFAFSTLLRSLRLKLLLTDHNLPLKDALMLNFLSQFLSFAIPIRAGEITKSVYLTSQLDIPLGKTLIWVFVDRFLDFWVIILSIGAILLFIPTGLPSNLVMVIFILSGVMTLMAGVLIKSQHLAKKVIGFLSSLLTVSSIKERFVTISHSFLEGLKILDLPAKTLGALTVISIVAIISDSLIWLVVMKSLGINQIGVLKSILGNSLSALTFLIPAAPGYVGSSEASGLAVFGGILGLDANLASAAAVLFHILVAVCLVAFGVTSLYFLKFDLGLVWKKIRSN